MNANLQEEPASQPPDSQDEGAFPHPIDLRKSAELWPFVGGASAGLVTLLALGWLLFTIF
jgi:hypothetical protein